MRGAIRGAIVMAGCLLCAAAAEAAPYDLVILHGRVMDPQTGADRIANLGVRAGKIAAISDAALTGRRSIEARGLVVAPGFIDIHSHAQYAFGYDQQAQDGVTTALELEEGVYPIAPFYAVRRGRTRINFGASVGLQSIRVKIKTDMDEKASLDAPFAGWGKILPRKAEWAEQPLSAAERAREKAMFDDGFAAGGLVMMVIGYCYADLVGRIPEAGSEFIYAYRVFGPAVGFIVGWFLLLYLVGVTVYEALALPWVLEVLIPPLKGADLYASFGSPITTGVGKARLSGWPGVGAVDWLSRSSSAWASAS